MIRLDLPGREFLRLDYTPDGTLLVAQQRVYEAGILVRWLDWRRRAEDGTPWRLCSWSEAAFNATHTLAAACRDDLRDPALFDARSRRRVRRLPHIRDGEVGARLAVSPDSGWVLAVAASSYGWRPLWAEAPARFRHQPRPVSRQAGPLGFSPSGAWYALPGRHNNYPLVLPADFRPGGRGGVGRGWQCPGPSNWSLGSVFIDDDHLAAVEADLEEGQAPVGRTSLTVYGVTARSARQVLTGHAAPLTALAVSADGQAAATGAADGTIRLWDAAAWSLRGEYDWQAGAVICLAFSPDGHTCAAGAAGTVVVWDLDDG